MYKACEHEAGADKPQRDAAAATYMKRKQRGGGAEGADCFCIINLIK